MARMLYLRDIEVDVHVRCCACGHEGVLPRAALQRRFGPNYPVLSIAPHFRCSKCDSRDTESRPAPAHLTVAASAANEPAEAPSLAGPLAALQGLLDAVRTRGEEEEPAEAPQEAPKPPPKPAEPDDIPLEQLIADGPAAPESGRRPLWEPISLADMAARLEAEASPPDDDLSANGEDPASAESVAVEDELSPLDQTMAALRGMIDTGEEKDGEDEEDAFPPVFSPKALVRSDFDEDEFEDDPDFGPDFGDEPPDEATDEEPSEEEILAFAIRDPEKAPPPWERKQGWEREPDDQPLDKTIAALRDMVHEAAAEPAETPPETKNEPLARPRLAVVLDDEPEDELEGEPVIPASVDTAEAPGDEDVEEDAPKPRKSAQELEMEEALRALRALVEADDPDEDEGEPVPFRRPAPVPEEDPEALTPDDILAPGKRAPWDDGPPALDLVDELKDDDEDDTKAGKPDPSPLDKTIAALRGMLELDGKRGR